MIVTPGASARRTSVVIQMPESKLPLLEVHNATLPPERNRFARVCGAFTTGCVMLYAAYSIIGWVAPRAIHQTDQVGFHNHKPWDFDR